MQLISPDILIAATGLSVGAAGFGLFVGLLLWAFGWRWHKFWVVFGITTGAGVLGLSAGQAAGGHVLVLGVLLAFAGGVMALEVAKLLAFIAGGLGAWLAVQAVLPQAQEMWAVFLAGGLFGVLLYRLWTMLLTSFLGTVLTWHCAALFAAGCGLDCVAWAKENAAALNGGVLVAVVMGVIVQALLTRAEAGSAPAAVHEHEKPAGPHWWNLKIAA